MKKSTATMDGERMRTSAERTLPGNVHESMDTF